MEIINKPDLKVFASEAKSGEIAKFPDILRGWGITFEQTQGKPPLEWMNDAFKRVDLNNLYLLQQGIPRLGIRKILLQKKTASCISVLLRMKITSHHNTLISGHY